jgi:hypothetical protein
MICSLMPANTFRDVLDVVSDELDVDLVRLARRESGVKAVVSVRDARSKWLT